MHANYTYRPLLRSRTGEAIALKNLTPPAKSRLSPIISLVAKPPGGFAEDIAAAWGGGRMALDGAYNVSLSGSIASFSNHFGAIGTGGVQLIPSIELGETGQYLHAVKTLVGSFAPGLVLKVRLEELINATAWPVDGPRRTSIWS
ncbi:beta family protein [Bradyrhizobium sp. JYMT SZCCT0428]|uniref:beta family protein n=1 Tax=Bradyrhizobium sp. JYMT SZCCT0428 TaxID=2807673 RepID=UPI001BAA728F|nr:hypothetical protein [Bradyrhizobium sp. JYMT SZCCT0428]MBR1156263.1 hypothetical protein [Bradyrhizobium sp. JYMT SZCCT0428]